MNNFTRTASSCIVICSSMRKQFFCCCNLVAYLQLSERGELKETFYSIKKRKYTLPSYALAAARRFKCDLGLFVELLEFSEDCSPWESVKEKLAAIR